jgi:CRISPR-associated protein Cas5d
MKRGIIEFIEPEAIPENDRRILHEMPMKPFGETFNNFTGLKEFTIGEVGE